jgi:hypothetical protein
MGWKSGLTGALSPHYDSRSAIIHNGVDAAGQFRSVRPARPPKRASAWARFMLLASLMLAPALQPLQSLAQSNEVSSDSEVSQSNTMDAPARPVETLESPEPKAPIGALSGAIFILHPKKFRGPGSTICMASLQFRRSR